MANTLTTTARNTMLDALGTSAAYASLHTADPSTTGTNEVTGGSPAYARKSVSWNAASSGTTKTTSADITFDVPACTVAYVGLFTALTAGTFLGAFDVTDEIFAAQGTYKLNSGSGITGFTAS